MPALDELTSWDVERRADGAVIVRVHSTGRFGRQLPDAVFAFRPNDPQYDFWEQQLRSKMGHALDIGDGAKIAASH